MGLATDQRHTFSDALLEVGAEAPTLCEGWTAYDLAAHCWVRERSAKALLGIGAKRYRRLAEEEMAKTRERYGFVELASRLRDTPRTPVTLLPGADDLVNGVEYLIHTEDVRRGGGLPRRPLDRSLEDLLWRRLRGSGRLLFAGSPTGVLLERDDVPEPPVRAKAGASTVTVVGRPGELLLFAFGRTGAADVRLIGEPASVDALRRARRGV